MPQRPSLHETNWPPMHKEDECLRCWMQLPEGRRAICTSCAEEMRET